jgi:dephospho-CoA kinase
MLVVGLTGGLGSGKSTVAKAFSGLGVPVIDTDEISHALTARGGSALAHIRRSFGPGVFKAEGALDRAALRTLILVDAKAKQKLETILHPMIREVVKRRLGDTHAVYVLVVIPLLIETGAYASLLDRVLVVDCREETQVKRALARGGWDEAEIRSMMARQVDRKTRLARADDVIDNEGDESVVASLVASLHQTYLALAQNRQSAGA